MEIKDAIAEAHNTAVEKGFWKEDWNLGEKLMLITSELGEALEAVRTGKEVNRAQFDLETQEAWENFSTKSTTPITLEEYSNVFVESFKKNIKDSFEDELADAAIRLFDLAGKMNVDLDFHIRKKMDYNKTRERLHGKKF